MRITLADGSIFEGTPDEFAQLCELLPQLLPACSPPREDADAVVSQLLSGLAESMTARVELDHDPETGETVWVDFAREPAEVDPAVIISIIGSHLAKRIELEVSKATQPISISMTLDVDLDARTVTSRIETEPPDADLVASLALLESHMGERLREVLEDAEHDPVVWERLDAQLELLFGPNGDSEEGTDDAA